MNTDIECRLSGPENPECFQLRIGEQIHNLHAWQLITLIEAVNLAWLHWLGSTRIDIIRSYLELDQREKLVELIEWAKNKEETTIEHKQSSENDE